MKIVSRIFFIAFALLVPFLIYGFGIGAWRAIETFSVSNARWQAFLIGAATFVPTIFVGRKILPATWAWLETFEHELTHLIVGLLFLKLPVGFRVSAHAGGEVKHIGWGTTGQTWVTLAPYFLPTVSIFVVLVAWAFGIGTGYLLITLGWTTVFHLVTNWAETSFRQPDLKKAGLLKTLIVLPVMNLVCYGAVLAYVAGGAKGFSEFWIQSVARSYELLTGLRS